MRAWLRRWRTKRRIKDIRADIARARENHKRFGLSQGFLEFLDLATAQVDAIEKRIEEEANA